MSARPLDRATIARTFWPLALSWSLMAGELPAIGAVVARLPDPKVHLAAFGGIVFPVALLVEAPIIMLLAASTALSSDARSYRQLARFTAAAGIALTVVHALLAFTPLYDALVVRLLDPPAEVIEPGRLGLRLLLPWSWAIADRRFHQGVLIRCGRSRAVGLGTGVRLCVTGSALAFGLGTELLPGIAVAASALTLGVCSEMAFARWVAAPVVREDLARAPARERPLTPRSLLRFYVPLALTPLLTLLTQPIGSAAMGRMPLQMSSLAVWPVLNGLVFLSRAGGVAFNEVAVRHAGDPGGREALARFAVLLALVTVGAMALMTATPLAGVWFHGVSGLDVELAHMARTALWLGLPLPALTVAHSYYQGVLVQAHATRGVTEAVGVFLLVTGLVLAVGIALQRWSGLYVALGAVTVGAAAQAAWLRWRVARCGAGERRPADAPAG